ncbi:hypothetical protein PG985_005367 [Apiospora marii]|uniref:uncharacterized protein n=1 Tax=Apiospora marii TaxID=335849 RepID=UPI003131C549
MTCAEDLAVWQNEMKYFADVDTGLSDTDVRDPAWGFVIYRCAEGHNAAWNRAVQGLQDSMQESLEYYKRQDLLPSHDLRAIDDPALYRATHRQVREHFLSWGLNDLKTKLHTDIDPYEKYMSTGYYSPEYHRPRYRYCLVVDDLCLESFDQVKDEYDRLFPAVKLLSLQWWGPTIDEEEVVDGEVGPESHPTDEDVEWWFHQDVGWMYMSVCDYAERYTQLSPGGMWHRMYTRPPYLDSLRDRDEEFMGWWRPPNKSRRNRRRWGFSSRVSNKPSR